MESKLNLNTETLEAIQDLIEANLDSSKVLKEAAEAIDHDAMAPLFKRVAAARDTHAAELQRYVRVNQEEATDKGSLAGDVRKQWLKLRSAINSGNPTVVLSEAEAAEDVIKAKYENLMVKTAGSAMNDVLMRQFREVKYHHDLIRNLRDAAKAA
jgi:uncharacterized protein (TIGR02284 family)